VQAGGKASPTSISITSKGCDIRALCLTYKGTCELLSDQETKDWLLSNRAKRLHSSDKQAERALARLNHTPNRRVLKFNPVKKQPSTAV
jgi:hypothetical protein